MTRYLCIEAAQKGRCCCQGNKSAEVLGILSWTPTESWVSLWQSQEDRRHYHHVPSHRTELFLWDTGLSWHRQCNISSAEAGQSLSVSV